MIYILCFLISILFCYIATEKSKTKKSRIIFSILSILTPALLAGLRDVTIGTDVEVYVVPAFNSTFHYSNIFEYCNNVNLEFLFKVLTYVVARIFKDVNIVLFSYHLVICGLFYFGAYMRKNKMNSTIIYSLFLLIYYNMSLNIMRQFLALGVVFIALKYAEERKLFKFLFLMLIAILFHSSAFLAVFIYFIYSISEKKHKILYSLAITTVIIILIFGYNEILSFLTNFGIIDSKYIRYAMNYETSNISFFDTFSKFLTIFITIFQWKLLKNDKDNFYFTFMCILDLIILQIGIFSQYATRMSLYFGIVGIINVARIISISKNNKLPLTILIYTFYLFYFYYIYILGNACETYPYILS